jgi:hypothetical protein
MARVPKSQVEESAPYDDLVTETPKLKKGEQPKKPPPKAQGFPKVLKVHFWKVSDCEKFCQVVGIKLTSDDRKLTYTKSQKRLAKNKAKYTENRENPFIRRERTQGNAARRVESQLWVNTLDYNGGDAFFPYLTVNITFPKLGDLVEFSRLVKQKIALGTASINYPYRNNRVWKYEWKSLWKDHNPKYPIYVISKGRADSRLTVKALESKNIPYYVVIEPQDYEAYSWVIDPKKILVLPFSNHGQGPGRARNWCWDHSKKNGFKRHWVMDDNIEDFFRLEKTRKIPVADGGLFRVIEEWVDRFKNLPITGLQYDFFCIDRNGAPPVVLNTRIYSCLLIENSCPFRWRGRYNEDTILSLDVLKAGMCTAQFNILLQGKGPTQALGGGNTAEFYANEGTWNKSQMLETAHPDVAKVKWKFSRFHHEVNYRPFKDNKLEFVEGYTPKKNMSETSKYAMEKVKLSD